MPSQDEIRRLMKARAASKRQTKQRIVSPLAMYTSAGKLVCKLCRVALDTELLWKPHCTSARHLQALRVLQQRRLQAAKKARQSQVPKASAATAASSSTATGLGGLVQHASSSSDSDSDSDTNNGKAPTTTVTSTSKVVSAEEEARGQAPVVEVETMPSDFFDAAPTPSDDGGAAESGVAGEDDTPSTSNPNGTASAAVTAEDEDADLSLLQALADDVGGDDTNSNSAAGDNAGERRKQREQLEQGLYETRLAALMLKAEARKRKRGQTTLDAVTVPELPPEALSLLDQPADDIPDAGAGARSGAGSGAGVGAGAGVGTGAGEGIPPATTSSGDAAPVDSGTIAQLLARRRALKKRRRLKKKQREELADGVSSATHDDDLDPPADGGRGFMTLDWRSRGF